MLFIMYMIDKIRIIDPKPPTDDVFALIHTSATFLSCPSSCAKNEGLSTKVFTAFE